MSRRQRASQCLSTCPQIRRRIRPITFVELIFRVTLVYESLLLQNYASSQFASNGGYAFADSGQESYLQPVFMNPKYQAHSDSAAEYQAAYSVPMMDGRSFAATPGSVSYESSTPANEPQYALSTTIEAKSGFDSRGSLYAKPNALRAAPSRKTSINQGYLDVDAEPEV